MILGNCNHPSTMILLIIYLVAAVSWKPCEAGCIQHANYSIRSSNRLDSLKLLRTSPGESLHFHDRNESTRNAYDVLEFHRNFHSFNAYEARMLKISKSNKRIRLESVGHSFEGRKLYLAKISSNFSGNKPVIFIDGGHHAREWISISTAMYALETLAQSDNNLKRYDFWFIPISNPDGYEYSRNGARYWRKTRSHETGESCLGVDLNRNYPVYWNKIGSSSDPCDDTYAGRRALSEPESRAVADVLVKHRKRIKMYITFHTYGQLILYPYGYKAELTKKSKEHIKIAKAWINSVRKVRGTNYRTGSAGQLMGTASGGSDDFAILNAGIRYSFTIELPPGEGEYYTGFLLPPKEIIPIGEETVIGLLAMSNSIVD